MMDGGVDVAAIGGDIPHSEPIPASACEHGIHASAAAVVEYGASGDYGTVTSHDGRRFRVAIEPAKKTKTNAQD